MIRLTILGICCLIVFACAAQPKYKEVDVEAELRKNSQDFTARHPESAPTAVPAARVQKTSELPKPSIMALPAGTRNLKQGIELLNQDPFVRAALNAIDGYLTENRYSVKSAEESFRVNEAVLFQSDVAGQDEDQAYIASLAFGAEVLIKFSSDYHRGQILANLSAFESTSGRMLGTQTAAVNDNGTRKEELIASAMHKAMPGLLKKIQAYWEEDSKSGIPYKVVLKISGESPESEALYNRATNLLKKRFPKVQTNSMTGRTADLTVYAAAGDFGDSYELYSEIRRVLGSSFDVKKNLLVQKLLILEIE